MGSFQKKITWYLDITYPLSQHGRIGSVRILEFVVLQIYYMLKTANSRILALSHFHKNRIDIVWTYQAYMHPSLGINVSSLTRVAHEFPTDFKWDQYSWIQALGIFNPTLTKCWRIWCGRNIGMTLLIVDPSPFGESTSHSTPMDSSRVGCICVSTGWRPMMASKFIV